MSFTIERVYYCYLKILYLCIPFERLVFVTVTLLAWIFLVAWMFVRFFWDGMFGIL